MIKCRLLRQIFNTLLPLRSYTQDLEPGSAPYLINIEDMDYGFHHVYHHYCRIIEKSMPD